MVFDQCAALFAGCLLTEDENGLPYVIAFVGSSMFFLEYFRC